MDVQMLIAGEQTPGEGGTTDVHDPFRGDVVATVPAASPSDVERALKAAVAGAKEMGRISGSQRAAILERVAELIAERATDFAQIITREQGKTVSEARLEVDRVPALLRHCASEAQRIGGDTLPLDPRADGADVLGLTVRMPVGVVVAITPFNYPLLLVAHKLAPAFAAGNAVILKPATSTPLSGMRLAQLFIEAGAPSCAMQCLTGSGSDVGMRLCADDRVRAITFTGSEAAGQAIVAGSGVKRLLLELGANCPLVVAADADLEQAAKATASGGYSNAGQACISAQRIIVERSVYADFLDALVPRVAEIRTGDPLKPETTMGPLISEAEACRVAEMVEQATALGGRVLLGGSREQALYQPTVVVDVPASSRIFREELFGPAVAVTSAADLDEALLLANDSEYGLAAGIFTSNVHTAMRFMREMQAGVIQINWSPLWRADAMPYGGVKRSGIGKEGPRWAIEELTEMKTVVFHSPSRQ